MVIVAGPSRRCPGSSQCHLTVIPAAVLDWLQLSLLCSIRVTELDRPTQNVIIMEMNGGGYRLRRSRVTAVTQAVDGPDEE